MKKLIPFLVLSAMLPLLPDNASAQRGAADDRGSHAVLMRLFGTNTAFSAQLSMRQLGAQNDGTKILRVGFWRLDDKVRTELDWATMKLPPELAANMKNVGLDKVFEVVLPQSKSRLLIYPAIKGYARLPMVGKDLEDAEKNFDEKVTKLGEEIFEGQPCVKYKRVFTSTGQGKENHEVTVWNATALKGFPVKIEMKGSGGQGLVEAVFRDVKLDRPASGLFEVPGGYKRHESIHALIRGASARK